MGRSSPWCGCLPRLMNTSPNPTSRRSSDSVSPVAAFRRYNICPSSDQTKSASFTAAIVRGFHSLVRTGEVFVPSLTESPSAIVNQSRSRLSSAASNTEGAATRVTSRISPFFAYKSAIRPPSSGRPQDEVRRRLSNGRPGSNRGIPLARASTTRRGKS
jgi:hypothetical protein